MYYVEKLEYITSGERERERERERLCQLVYPKNFMYCVEKLGYVGFF